MKTEEGRKQQKHYEEKIKDLTMANKKLSELYNQNRDGIAKRDDEINRLKDEVAMNNNAVANQEIRVRVQNLSNDNESLKNSLEDLQTRFDTKSDEFNQLHEEKMKLDELLKQTQGKIEDLNNNKFQELMDQINELKALLAKKEEESDILKKDINGLVKDLNEYKRQAAERDSFQQNQVLILEQKDSLITQLQEQLNNTANEKQVQIDKRVEVLVIEKEGLQNDLVNTEKQRDSLSLKLKEMEKQRDNFSARLKESQKEYKDLETRMSTKLAALQEELEKVKKNYKDDLIKANTKIEDISQKLFSKESNIVELNGRNEVLTSQVENFKKKIEDVKSFKNLMKSTIQKLLKHYEPISSNLSCLSCLNFLESPLMLICGHSICMK